MQAIQAIGNRQQAMPTGNASREFLKSPVTMQIGCRCPQGKQDAFLERVKNSKSNQNLEYKL